MKNDRIRISFTILALAFFISLSGCYTTREKEYYSDINNYITDEATVDNIIYNEDDHYIILWLSEIDPSYQSSEFIIRGESVSLVIENDILRIIKKGDKITFTSAPGFFGDGYYMPIIGLSIGDIEILEIEIGYQNLMNSY